MSPAEEGTHGPAPLAFHSRVASAIEGDGDALALLLDDDRLEDLIIRHRMGPALFVAARDLGVEGPAVERCHEAYLVAAMRWVRLRAVLSQIGEVLDSADVPWIPLKGLDTAERFFPRPELRPTSDLDVMVPAGHLRRAMQALEGSGWTFPSTPLQEKYQRDEGYNWHGLAPHGEALELHYRLWGMVPDSLVESCWQTAVPAPELGQCSRLLEPSMAFVVSAVHSWVHAGRPQLIYWWELKLIADRLEDGGDVVRAAREHGFELPVGLAAEYAGQLWEQPLCSEIGRALLADLRLPERVALGQVRRRGIDAMSLELLYVTRLLARRPSRMGWKSIFRRVWPHPGIVENTTPPDLQWWRRRGLATLTNLGLTKKLGIRN